MHRILRVVCLALALFGFAETASAQNIPYFYKDGWKWSPGFNGGEVDGCFGNCGAGCTQKNDGNCIPSSAISSGRLGTRYYYESDINITREGEYVDCIYEGDSFDRRYTITWQEAEVLMKYEYTGYVRAGCITHDATCPEWTWVGCFIFGGCGSDYGFRTWEYTKWATGYREERYPTGWCGLD